MEEVIRVRFAPSPTGALHIGGARTAFFNWLFAKQHGGNFILRIDDTDATRSTETSYQQILDGFRWLGLDWDEGPDVGGVYGPYRQSQRADIYRSELQRLIEADKVYPCFCSPEQLADDRRQAQEEGRTPRYVGRCRHLSQVERDERIALKQPFVYRLRSPEDGETIVSDLIRGEVHFSNEEIDDFVVWKADDGPTYHFASCVDDAKMQISHVIRAEEHLSNTPRHIALFAALDARMPLFAHVPMILAPDRSKLSKRHGATSVEEYRESGILPEALINYLFLLGFAPGEDREIVSPEEAVQLFDLKRVAKHAAVYDTKKLEWLNAHYLRAKSVDGLLTLAQPGLLERGWLSQDPDAQELAWVRWVISVMQERVKSVPDLLVQTSYYFASPTHFDEKGARKHFLAEGAADRLELTAARLKDMVPFTVSVIETEFRKMVKDSGAKAGQFIHPARLALTGVTGGPGLFDVMAILGRDNCAKRLLDAAIKVRQGQTLADDGRNN